MTMIIPMEKRSFGELMSKLSKAVVSVASQTKNNAAAAVREMSDTTADVVETTCLFDGTWQRLGNSSLIDVLSCISSVTYKVLDDENLTKYCRSCLKIKKLKLPKEKERKLLEIHECTKSNEGSSSAVELVGVKRIFGRSVESRNLRITGYIGDGNPKTYDIISKAHPYGDSIEIEQFECVGHVQKRVGNNLRKFKIKGGSTKLADGKTLGVGGVGGDWL